MTTRDDQDVRYWLTPAGCTATDDRHRPGLDGRHCRVCGARCAQTDPESFFPDKGGSTREAKEMCALCPVAAECLDYALNNDERFGIWGGLSERDRRKIKRAMQDDAGVERVSCSICSETFHNATALTTHVRVHDRTDIPCPHCDHVGKGAAVLAVHIHHSHPELRTAS